MQHLNKTLIIMAAVLFIGLGLVVRGQVAPNLAIEPDVSADSEISQTQTAEQPAAVAEVPQTLLSRAIYPGYLHSSQEQMTVAPTEPAEVPETLLSRAIYPGYLHFSQGQMTVAPTEPAEVETLLSRAIYPGYLHYHAHNGR